MIAQATTRGRRFTRHHTENRCDLSRSQARALRNNKPIEVTAKQAKRLEELDLATIAWPKISPKQPKQKQTKTDSASSRADKTERT